MPSKTSASTRENWEGLFSGIAGLWLALTLIKFGNPVILGQQIQAPTSQDEMLLAPWPMAWGYMLLSLALIVGLLGLRFWNWRTTVPRWLLVLPAVWLLWQGVSAFQTVDRGLTTATMKHFIACVVVFYLGLFAFSHVSRLKVFWIGLIGGFLVVLAVGWRQHFGGLEESRRFLYTLPDWQSLPPEFLKKVASNRIYSTLFYPNALAGVVILLLPVCLVKLWPTIDSESPGPKRVACLAAALLGLGCLYWSGSKAGWLIVLGQGIVALLHAPLPRKAKWAVVGLLAVAGCGGFWFKYQGYFDRGATSVSARFDYWRAGWTTLQHRPLLGSGPGTFMVTYRALKPADAEMSRLAHNDFLQQGSDSGWIGLLTFTGWFWGSVWLLYRRRTSPVPGFFGFWLGLAGAMAQGVVEFGLYIPALSWTTFFLLGWLLGVSSPMNQIDKAPAHS